MAESPQWESTHWEPAPSQPAQWEPTPSGPAQWEPAPAQPAHWEPAPSHPAPWQSAEWEPARPESAHWESAQAESTEWEPTERGPADSESAEWEPAPAPVFVDQSGLRSRLMRRFGWPVSVLGAILAAVMGSSLIGMQSDAPTMDIPPKPSYQPARGPLVPSLL
ncbi:hypothetical protein ACFVJI_14720 [Streptomyces sp. NPDC127584]|uniref:hypothetical protein n=1 Tax=Streptomyces sp. NPDC127584 TaxID=3345403 RepID=UPI003629B9FE